jgi:hypothetical protein
MEIILKGGPYDGDVTPTPGRDITFTKTEIANSENPAVIDYKKYRYVDTRETDGAGRPIFEYKPRAVAETVGDNVAVE